MEPSLQRVQLHVSRTVGPAEAQGGEAAQPIQLPGPSVWPLLLSVSVVVFVAGLLFIDNYPWLSLITIPLVLIGILGWALEDPVARPAPASQAGYTSTAAVEIMLGGRQEEADYPMTFGRTKVSAYPVKEKEEVRGRKHERLPGNLSSPRKVPGRIRLLRD